jgi:hypothetical protein
MNKFATLWNLGNDALGIIRRNSPQLNGIKAAKALKTYNLKSGSVSIAYFPEIGMLGTEIDHPNYNDVVKMAKRIGLGEAGYGHKVLSNGSENVAVLDQNFFASSDPDFFQEICNRVVNGLKTEGEECRYYGPSYNKCTGDPIKKSREKLCLREAGNGCEGKEMLDRAREKGLNMTLRPTSNEWGCKF